MKLVRRKKAGATENVLPLINVVFLLLIFFMLAGALEKADLLDIQPPETSGGAEVTQSPAVLLVAADGTLSFQDRILERDALAKTVSGYISTHPDTRLDVKADARSDAAEVIGLIEILRAAGVKNIDLLATGAS